MIESQREAVPRNDGGELDTTLAFLAFARSCVLKKVAGLNEGGARLGRTAALFDADRWHPRPPDPGW